MYLSTSLLRLFDESTEECRRTFSRLPADYPFQHDASFFMPGDIPAHLIQSEDLAIGYIADQAMVSGWQFKLHPLLIKILRIEDSLTRAAALKEANLKGARHEAMKYITFDDLLTAWLSRRARIRAVIDRISDTQMNFSTSHPLVTLEGTVFHAAVKLFVVHAAYHAGQFTQALKTQGRIDIVEFPFGHIGPEIPEVAKKYMAAVA